MKLWQIPDSIVESSLLEGERQLPNFYVSEDSPQDSSVLIQELDISDNPTPEVLSVRVESLLLSLGYPSDFTINWVLPEPVTE